VKPQVEDADMRAKFLLLHAMTVLSLGNCSSRPQVVTDADPGEGPVPEIEGGDGETTLGPETPDELLAVSPDAAPVPVYQQNYNRLEAGKRYRIPGLTVEAACGPDGSHCLKVSYVPNERGSPVLQFKEAILPAREYTLSYSVKFDQAFDFVRGGKLPGFAPENHTTGCQPIEADGWSSRLMWRSQGALEIYSYDQNRSSRCGEEYRAKGFQFAKDRFYRITQHLVLNAPADTANGQSRLYVDGKLVASSGNLQYRKTDSPDTLIKYVFFSTFFGGDDDSWSPETTVYAYFDDLVVYPGFYLDAKAKE
jgi:hypothetical protein